MEKEVTIGKMRGKKREFVRHTENNPMAKIFLLVTNLNITPQSKAEWQNGLSNLCLLYDSTIYCLQETLEV